MTKARLGKRGRVHVLEWTRKGVQALCGADRMSPEVPVETDEPVDCKRCERLVEARTGEVQA